jgi:arylsulfatase A-like enzyme
MKHLVGILALSLLTPTLAQAQATKKPNIIYIMSDDHASAAIGAYGSWLQKVAPTPNIDKLARQGMRFTSSLVTNSICTPCRASILTGKYSHKNGVYTLQDVLNPKSVTIAQLLRALGYQTALFGKWHLTSDPTGFDNWSILPGQGRYIDPKLKAKGEKLKEFPGYSEDVITDMSLDWLKKRDKTQPFFLCVHFKAPHRPWDPAPRFQKLFDGKTIPEPPTLLDDLRGRSKAVQGVRMIIGEDMNATDLGQPVPKNMDKTELRKWAYQIYMKRYLSCVAAVDENVGRILDFLDKEGLTEETLVIYTSDQGFFLGEHGFFDKRLMYEPCLTTPLIIRYPGHTRPGSVNDDMVLNIDHAPTFLELAGSKATDEMQGRSYKSLLDGKTPADWRKSMYYRYWMHLDESHNAPASYGVRTDRYTLIHYYGKALGMRGAKNVDMPPEWELFDRQKDPQQVRNVYDNADYAAVVRDLKAELEKLRKDLDDTK